jgi:hypothetical protein
MSFPNLDLAKHGPPVFNGLAYRAMKKWWKGGSDSEKSAPIVFCLRGMTYWDSLPASGGGGRYSAAR